MYGAIVHNDYYQHCVGMLVYIWQNILLVGAHCLLLSPLISAREVGD